MYITSENLQIMENCIIFHEATYRVIASLKGICNILRERESSVYGPGKNFFYYSFFLGIEFNLLYLRNSLY